MTVIFSNIKSDLLEHRHHYIANWRAAREATVWVESLGSRNPGRRDLHRLRGERAGQTSVRLVPAVKIVSPRVIPIHGSSLAYAFNAGRIDGLLRRLEVDPATTLAWVYLPHPSVLRVLQRHSWRCVVFDLCDDFGDISGVHPCVLDGERRIVETADVVLTTSERLKEKATRVRGADGVHYVPNAVDAARFEGVTPWSGNLRTVTYIGSVFEWFDEGLLAKVAGARRDLRFRVVGPVRRPLPLLTNAPNVEIVGPIPSQEVPGELGRCDLLMIPFRRGPLIDATDPLKIYEALAAGRPVLSTQILQARRFFPAVRCAESSDDWVRALADLETGKWDPRIEQWRAKIAREEDWKNRFAQIESILSAVGAE